MRWVVENVPTWVVGVVLIGGIPLLAVLVKHYLSEKKHWPATDADNDVAGFQAAIVAVVYAIVVGLTIVSLYDASVTASTDVSTEAADLVQLHIGDAVLPSRIVTHVDADVLRYAHAVVDNWTKTSEGQDNHQVNVALNDLYATFDSYEPHTAAQTDYLNTSVTDLDNLSQARIARQLEAQESGALPLVLWIGILLTSLVTLIFALLFSLEQLKVACAMVGSVAAVLAVNIFVLIEFGYPFIGSVSVGPGKFIDVIHLVGG